MYWHTLGILVTEAIGENGSKIAYFSHSECTVRAQCKVHPQRCLLAKKRSAIGCLVTGHLWAHTVWQQDAGMLTPC